MELVVHRVLTGVWGAVGVWLLLVGFAAFVVVVTLAPSWRENAVRAEVWAAAESLRRDRVQDAARRLRGWAEELAAAADQATAALPQCHAQWRATEEVAQAAWRAYEAAEADARRGEYAAAYACPGDWSAGTEIGARRRLLRRLATVAYRRGDLSVRQLTEVLAERDGWDPRRPPADVDTKLRCAIRDHRWQVYREAARTERLAWQAVLATRDEQRRLVRQASAAAVLSRRAPTVASGWSGVPRWQPYPAAG